MKRILLKRLLLISFLTSLICSSAKAGIEPIPTGSFIVNMGVTPQTYANGLKPWGMLYDLIHNYKVQVKWVISQTKLKDGTDFTYNGVDYKGGTFIIPASYRNTTVNSRITYWQSQGVVGTTTTSQFNVDVTYTLKYTPRWTFDFQNGNIALNYLDLAGIPNAEYPKKYPDQLDDCDDLFVMPHADPTWDTHKNLLYWNLNTRGWIWYGCHAGSVVENLYNPANPSERMNFLSANGLVPNADHHNGTPPYSYLNPNDVEMQFMGIVDGACQNGAEEVYLPVGSNGWRPTTKASVYDPTQQDMPTLSTGPAGIIIYGRGFGDNNRGKVMMQAGHNFDKGTADAVAEIRAFFNFSFMSVYDKVVEPAIFPQLTNISSGQKVTYSVQLPQGVDPTLWTYHWTSSCGTFSEPFKATTVFTATSVASCTPCDIVVEITDGCGRTYYQSLTLQVCPVPPVAQDITTNMIINNPGTPAQKVGKDFPLAGIDADGWVTGYVIKSLPASGVLSYDDDGNASTPDVNITSLPSGGLTMTKTQAMSLKYDPVDGYSNNATFTYTVVDNSGLLDLTPATYKIPVDPPPVTTSFICHPAASNTNTYDVCPMQATDEGTIVSYTIVTVPKNNQGNVYLLGVKVDPGQVLSPNQITMLKFVPGGQFVGYAEITYTATDEKGVSDQTPATLTLQLVNQPPTANDISSSTIQNPAGLTQYSIPNLSATDVDGTIASYMVTNIPANNMGTLYLSGVPVINNQVLTPSQAGNLKFDPKDNFSGIAKFYFTATDNDGLTDNTPATFSIPVKDIVPIASDVTNNSINAGAGQTTIKPLVGNDPDSTNIITKFIITSLPNNVQGTLYYNNNGTYAPVTLNQELLPAQASSLKFDPNSWLGTATFKYTVKDDEGFTDPTPATVYIPLVNTKPTANNVTIATPVNDTAGPTTLVPGLSGTDGDGSISAFVITSLPASTTGVLSLNGVPVTLGAMISATDASQLQFTPVLHNGNDASFKFAAVDNLLAISDHNANYTITINMIPYKVPPVAANITNSGISMSPINVVLNPLSATDADGTVISYQIMSTPPASQGVLYVRGIPAFNNQVIPVEAGDEISFTPSGTFKGNVQFNYKAIDDDGNLSNNANLKIPVNNAVPVANSVTIAALKKGATVAIPEMSATDSDGQVNSFIVLTLPSSNTLKYDSAGTGTYINMTAGKILTPAQATRLKMVTSNTLGNDMFTFLVTDNMNDTSNIATYTIPVAANAENQVPIVHDVTSAAVSFNGIMTLVSALTATDVDGTIATITLKNVPPSYYGTLYYNSSGSVWTAIPYGNFKLTPTQATTLKFQGAGIYTGNALIGFIATDNDGGSSAMAFLTIPLVNQAPVATNITNAALISSDGPKLLSALAATDDGSIKEYVITSVPNANQGILILDGIPVKAPQEILPMYNGRLEFDPNPAFTGNATFNFTAVDDANQTDLTPATFTIPVTNEKPTVNDILSQVITNQPGTDQLPIPALSGVDADGSIANFYIQSLPPGGKLYKNGTLISSIPSGGYSIGAGQANTLTFDPNDNYSGIATFTYTAKDNSNNVSSNTATYTIPVNEAPTTNNVVTSAFTTTTPKTAIPSLVANDDGSVQFYSITTLPQSNEGTLYISNTPVTSLAQVDSLSSAQISQLAYQPTGQFDGAIFTYTATDNLGVIDVTPSVYLIPMATMTTLPVKLISFTGSKTGMDNILQWSTSEETNSDHFELQYSKDGINFNTLTSINANTNTTTRSDYNYTHVNVPGTIAYYRLKIFDQDGKFDYSNIVVLRRTTTSTIDYTVFPNPFVDQVTVSLTANTNSKLTMTLTDMNGRQIKTQVITVVKGDNTFTIDQLKQLPPGLYILNFRNDETNTSTKLMKIFN